MSISSVTPTGDLNKYKSAITISMCISLLYEFMKIMISATAYLLLLNAYCKRILMHCIRISHMFPTKRKA